MSCPHPARQVMEYPAHDLPVTGLAFSPGDTGVALGGFDLLAGSADYKITLFKTQGRCYGGEMLACLSLFPASLVCRIPASCQRLMVGVQFCTRWHTSVRVRFFFFAPEPVPLALCTPSSGPCVVEARHRPAVLSCLLFSRSCVCLPRLAFRYLAGELDACAASGVVSRGSGLVCRERA